MNKNSTKGEIKNYLLQHNVDRSKQSPYRDAAKALNVSEEQVRRVWRSLREQGIVETVKAAKANLPFIKEAIAKFRKSGNTAEVSSETNQEIRNEKDLATVCNIDLKEWKIDSWECKRYEAWIKNTNNEIESQPKYSVYAKMTKRTLDKDIRLQKDHILKELYENAPEFHIFNWKIGSDESPDRDTLYELSIPDLHVGKLAWGEESGEDFDLKIVVDRYNDAITELLSRVNLDKIERILLPIGNDLINVDNERNETTAGTRQNVDGRFPKIIRVAKDLLITTITRLAIIAPVDVLVVPGNHDNNTTWMLGEILDAYFHNTDRVSVDNSPRPRKYYQYGTNGFQYTHGNEEKHQELGLIFATEKPDLWCATRHRVAKLGHFHKSKKTNWVDADEFQGFQVQVLPSLSSADKWHNTKAFMSQKAAKSFLYHKEKGKIAEYTYTV